MAKKIVLVDASWLIFRAYYALPTSFSTQDGLHTNAVYGFALMFRKLFGGKLPDYAAVAFEGEGPTERAQQYREYKAQRPDVPPELLEQLPYVDRFVEAHAFKLLRVKGHEADDVIGTLATRAADAGMEVVIVSGDKDFAQLIRSAEDGQGSVRMHDTMRDVVYDPELVRKKWGVRPDQIIDLLALLGDKVDNIPGVPGVGEKGATELLAQYGTLDGILEHVDELKGRAKNALTEHRDKALLSRELATIKTDLDLGITFDDLAFQAPDQATRNALYRELEFYSLLGEEEQPQAEVAADATYRTITKPVELEKELKSLAKKPTAIFPIWDGPRIGARLVGVALSVETGRAIYIPLNNVAWPSDVARASSPCPPTDKQQDAAAPEPAKKAASKAKSKKARVKPPVTPPAGARASGNGSAKKKKTTAKKTTAKATPKTASATKKAATPKAKASSRGTAPLKRVGAHPGDDSPGSVSEGSLVGVLAAYLADPKAPKIVHDAKEAWLVFTQHGLDLRGVVADPMLASFLIDVAKLIPHRFDQVVKDFAHTPVPLAKNLTGAGQSFKAFGELPVEQVAEYACQCADLLATTWPRMEPILDEREQRPQMLERDLPLSWVLGRMELTGIRVDGPDLAQAGDEFAKRAAELETQIHTIAGREFNIGSHKQLADVLFEEMKLPVIRKTKTGYSTDAAVLETLAPQHEIARLLLEHRSLTKLINTYTDVLQRAINPLTGRVHCVFQQTVSVSGRIITTDRDLQRTPVRTPEGKRIRRAFVGEKGCTIIAADWSQIELRILAHITDDPNLLDAFLNDSDIHRRTASEIFGVKEKDVTSEQRGIGKTINFATIYGQGATALGQQLGIPRKEAKQYIDNYFKSYAGVATWQEKILAEANETGFVTTIAGRRRYIHELTSGDPMVRSYGERIATNTPIQGSAADICKAVMREIDRRFTEAKLRTRMLVQIHDELLFEAPDSEVDKAVTIIRECMEHTVELKVPLKVDIGVGTSWADAK